ncbi:MAG TPA: efflux RND transporter permease subunit [Fimbriimonas sp.]
MNIGKFSVTRPVAVTMRIASLVLLGFVCLMRLPIDLLPRVDIPTVAISVGWPNTSPEEMESQITRPLEQAVSTIKGLERVQSTSRLGSAFVRVQFKYGVDVDEASIDVMQAVQRAKGRFPRGDDTISEPSVFKFDPSSMPILVYGVSGGDDNLIKLRDQLINEISPMIESAGGVAAVNVSGGQDRAIMVDVDPEKLRAFGLSVADISSRIRQENMSAPAGMAQESRTEYSIRSIGYFQSLDDLRKVPIRNVNGQLVTLDQVANVRDASQDIRSYTRMNGEPALNVAIVKQSDANTVETGENVKKQVEEIQKRYPNLKFRMSYDQSQFISKSILDLQETAVIGGILAILIITFFLRNLRSTFVVALSIPISIISTFSLLYFCGFTLNTLSLSGLALATGLIVDDAIVVLENIYRHIERDRKRSAEAAVSGTQEILSAVFASTFTVMIVFMPLLLIQGQTGQMFTQFALVVVFSLAISLLDATTVVPMLASRMVKESEVIEEAHPELRAQFGHRPGPLTRVFDRIGGFLHSMDAAYRRNLEWALHRRYVVVVGALSTVLFAWWLWPSVGSEQLPATDSGNLNVRVRLPISTAVEKTDQVMRQVEKILMADPDVETVIAGAGTGVGLRGGGGGAGHEGGATVRLKDERASRTEDVVKRLQARLSQIPGVRAQVSPFDVVANMLGGNVQSVGVNVYGQTLEQISGAAQLVQAAMSDVPGLENVDVSIQEATPELQWNVDREKAQLLGITFQDIATTLTSSTTGQLSTYYQERGFQYPIYVQVPRNLRQSIEELSQLPVAGSEKRGAPVLLGQVAKPVVGAGPNEIQRINRQRYMGVGGRIADRPESEVKADVEKALDKVQLPQGTYWAFGPEQIQRDQEYSGLGVAIFLAIALIYMLLASQFESFIYPLVVLTSVPLCAIGLVLALFLTDRAFGLTAFIGLLMLIGIVVKNGILLVDYTNQLRGRGLPREEAILTAGPTRLRPILMTTLAACLGMMPLALGLGAGSEMYAPLATAVIGGLATSTILTLFVVPVVYTFFDDLSRRFNPSHRDLSRSDLVEPTVSAVERAPEPTLTGQEETP